MSHVSHYSHLSDLSDQSDYLDLTNLTSLPIILILNYFQIILILNQFQIVLISKKSNSINVFFLKFQINSKSFHFKSIPPYFESIGNHFYFYSSQSHLDLN